MLLGLPIQLVVLQAFAIADNGILQNPKSTIFGLPIQLVILQDFMRIRINQDFPPGKLDFLQIQRVQIRIGLLVTDKDRV